jgi:uncharacterized protein YbaA (DUF1428 family)
MKYVSSWVVPVPKKKIAEYRRQARRFGKLWMEHGALEYVECVADDVKKGKVTSFPRSVELKRNETVVLAWLGFKSRAHHDRVMKKAMADPKMQKLMDPGQMVFDGMRMFWGDFEVMFKL